jgi:hypothetical protein
VLEALDWVRREMMHRGSPDFIRQRELELRVHHLAFQLSRSGSSIAVSADIGHSKKADPTASAADMRAHRK